MLVYLGFGVLWSFFLEYYTTKHFKDTSLGEWYWIERFLHIALWPAMILFFVYIIFKGK